MAEVAPSALARRVEAISGLLALFAGLGAIGFELFAPLVEVHYGTRYVTYWSHWAAVAGYVADPLGLAALGLCLICLLAIGSGAYAHAMRRSARLGRLMLWCGTALLALEVAWGLSSFSPVTFTPLYLVAPALLPALGLALLASGTAAN